MTRRQLFGALLVGAAVVTGVTDVTDVTVGRTASATPAPDVPVVRVADGALRGEAIADHVRYQGIPYAAPPVGALRWHAPRPTAAWTGVRDATKPGAKCPQAGFFPGDPPVVGSEDCLFLNVTAPRAPHERRPVLVFVHGGGFTGGEGALYDPSRIVEQNGVLVVTVNYRLGALGFLEHPALRDPAAGNFGIADQQAALGWVRRNIAAFGGDPRNVTLWGESAGAFSICAQLASPRAKGLFDKVIGQSGPCVNDLRTAPEAQRRGAATAKQVGCPDPATAAQCLRDTPVQALVGIDEDQLYRVHRDLTELPWVPVVGTPVIPAQPEVALRRGSVARVPVLLGSTHDELRSFVAGQYDEQGKPVTAAQYPDLIRELYGPADGKRVLAHYPASAYPSPSLALATAVGDEGRFLGACRQLRTDDLVARRSPVYAFEYAEPQPTAPGGFPYGAAHGSDVAWFFDANFPGAPPTDWTPEQRAFADRLTRTWAVFAGTGTPGWPAYRGDVVQSITMAHQGPVDLAAEHQCRFWETL